MSKHTPGPWAVIVGYDGSISVNADGPRRINLTTAGTPVIADVCQHSDAEHFSGEANARLIAAAPDLLAKCEKVVAWLDRLAEKSEQSAKDRRFVTLAEAHASDAKNYRSTAADIRAAIAKATGEAA